MKTTLKHILLLLTVLTVSNIFSQNHFIENGVIEFEKKSNMYALISKKIKGETESYYQLAFEGYKKNHPQFKTAKSTLSFSKNKSLYKFMDFMSIFLSLPILRPPFASFSVHFYEFMPSFFD